MPKKFKPNLNPTPKKVRHGELPETYEITVPQMVNVRGVDKPMHKLTDEDRAWIKQDTENKHVIVLMMCKALQTWIPLWFGGHLTGKMKYLYGNVQNEVTRLITHHDTLSIQYRGDDEGVSELDDFAIDFITILSAYLGTENGAKRLTGLANQLLK